MPYRLIGGTIIVWTKRSLYPYPTLVASIFTKSCQYAIRAVLYLAQSNDREESVHVRQISQALEIPHHFLGKVLQILSRHGIVSSQKGMKGGFHLARHPHEITLFEITNAIDGMTVFDECIFGFPGCRDSKPCSIHTIWKDPKESILTMLRSKSIADLSKEMKIQSTPTSVPFPHLTQLQ